jgi:hypothetical protein
MQEDSRTRARASHSLAYVHWASVQGENHVPALGKGLQHFREEADKIDERVRIGPTALAPQDEDVVSSQMPSQCIEKQHA